MPYSPVVFNEGEPLDPNKLNQLQTNFTEVNKNSLANATKTEDGSLKIPLIDAGTVSLTTVVGKTNAVVLPKNSAFKGIPTYFCTIGGGSTDSNQWITLGIQNASTNPAVYAISNVAGKALTINYLAIEDNVL